MERNLNECFSLSLCSELISCVFVLIEMKIINVEFVDTISHIVSSQRLI
ncbi:hypothetical protein BACCOPRO_03674 [Phocaeicola coprophilus DSM 18228 = JCM 13818]|uniref:Uncharacterized protein n=1 Tax=Phocaeicola coprophilus DSM 18228 = JCM 13818 TaxID=547042 RepID=S0FD21_9BACT|nr:hypothetical protein BACCOPRO_03674 [Phocaeicola coprophilus DSM 18228 = JCM 13818]